MPSSWRRAPIGSRRKGLPAPARDEDGGVAAEPEEGGPERRCILTGEIRPKAELIRFVLGPDREVVPDVAGRLPGRGLWLTASRDIVGEAVARRVFARAARAPASVPEDLSERVEALLVRRCCDLLGLARRAGQAVAGFEKVKEALRRGQVGLLLEASDAAEGGRGKLRRLAGPELRLSAALTAAELAAGFGREHAVHAAVSAGGFAERLGEETARLAAYRTPRANTNKPTAPTRRPRGKTVTGSR
jgi:predicted RNA-binding protein YlxR (DUF448 family)